jgi:hypothetical protein
MIKRHVEADASDNDGKAVGTAEAECFPECEKSRKREGLRRRGRKEKKVQGDASPL